MSEDGNDRDELDGRAAEYALGTLEGEGRDAFERDLAADGAARSALAKWEALLAQFAAGPEVEPPAGLWQAIEEALDAPEADLAGMTTIRDAAGDWQEILPGVEKKVLFIDREAAMESYLLRMAPGSSMPAHDHAKTEECMMISGEVWIGDLRLVAGDYHVAASGTPHEAITSPRGATAFIRSAYAEAA